MLKIWASLPKAGTWLSQFRLVCIDVTALEGPSVFKDFDDYWHPFTLGTGPAPGYCMSLTPEARERLKAKLSDTLPREADGSIRLITRAWAVRARRC
jgi:hypothetical protein